MMVSFSWACSAEIVGDWDAGLTSDSPCLTREERVCLSDREMPLHHLGWRKFDPLSLSRDAWQKLCLGRMFGREWT